MKKFLPYILAVTMLIAGFLIGSFTTGRITRNKIERFSSVRSPEHFKQHMVRELGLTEEQQKLIDPIVDAHGEKLHVLTKEYRETFSELQQEFHEQLEPILTEQQRKKMEERRREFQKGYKRDGRDGPRGPGDRRGEGRRYHDDDMMHHDGLKMENRKRD